MTASQLLVLYVENLANSLDFYTRARNARVLESSPQFAMLESPDSGRFALWNRAAVVPPVDVTSGAMELVFMVDSPAMVDSLYSSWKAQGARVLQEPTALEFGYSFMVLDPDGHRLRVLADVQP